ncbi:hypothetical protein MHB48_14130 [Psychrobacillus sp. FSL H8-0483]|uniref:hypothetical protein n=1 Tax=Psychrobacillus sp. FSL H8-0483 TaxID=2921389 RepID=UPI003159FCCF
MAFRKVGVLRQRMHDSLPVSPADGQESRQLTETFLSIESVKVDLFFIKYIL